ncbi:PREDICTED: uncharacterized protein LOC109485011 isoform X1 [Branchiostoma belcheri]|uniref:Uncharacterized protein LOC109485011 isoform X1 n=1 Tax=Branchiostoma belcheri TaxID=7741 RepID=A0A6P4ZRX2_BRABE|nr:PREDICTED: uncharacterized protein LOC109485011 isoform X1 [Branchiostoma belcheri]XP_019643951.1 PREDICTED: uncharacterized protein LOC109485011 isoform X1 [Branchiostoma belcheri]
MSSHSHGVVAGRNQALYDLKLDTPAVLAESEEVKKVYTESGTKGHLPANRTNVLFLGDKRAGKTSLKRHLSDSGFDPEESRTVGIERELVQADEVDEDWAEVKETEHNEFQQGSALYTAIHVNEEYTSPQTSVDNTETEQSDQLQRASDENGNGARETELSSTSKWPFYVRLVIAIFLPFSLASLEIFERFGPLLLMFVLLLWIILFQQVHFRGFSIGTGAAIVAIFTKYFHTHVPLPDSSIGVAFVSLLAAAWFVLLGACLGLGVGIGMGLALCCMQMSTVDALKFRPALYESIFESLCIIVGVLLSSRLKSLLVIKMIAFALPIAGILLSGQLSLSLATMGISGLTIGIFLVMGLDLERHVASRFYSKYKNKVLVDVLGFLMAILFGRSIGLNFVFDFVNVFFTLVHLGLIIYFEAEFRRMRQTKYPYRLVGKNISQFKSKEDLPKKMLLLDFAGDRLYYATHPLFISSHAIFLVVFSLAKFAQDETYHMRRLIFWLHSIAAHAKNPECKVFLVGTHRDLVQRKRRKQITKIITKKIGQYPRLLGMIVLNMVDPSDNSTHHTFVFCVDNSAQIYDDSEGLRLRETLVNEVNKAEHVKHEIPLRWLKFYDLTNRRKRRRGGKDYPKNCTSSTQAVWDMVQKESIFKPDEKEDFDQMLDFYNRVGEIKLMETFVVFDPQLVVDLLTNLLQMTVEHGAMVPLKLMEKLCKKINAPFEEVITILRKYDLVCPLLNSPGQDDTTTAQYYIIPLNLKRLDKKRQALEPEDDVISSDPETDDRAWLPFWQNRSTDVSFFFNFREFNPDAVFVRLLARCLYVSQRSHDMSNRRHVYSDAGRFYQSNDFYYKIELCCPADAQNLIQVTVGRAPESGVRDLLCRIDCDIKDICGRDFPYVSYTFGIRCEACRPDDQPSAQIKHPRHILNISTHEEDFPSDDTVRLLCERQVHEVNFRRWPDIIRVIEDSTSVSQSDIERGRSIEMTEAHCKLLTKNRLQLVRNVTPDDVIDHLIQDGVMSEKYAEELRHQPTTRGRAGMVLDHLPRRGDAAFYSFKRALQKTNQKHVAKLLEE